MSQPHVTGQVRLGIIGFGAQGSMYAKFIADGLVPQMVIGAVADIDPDQARPGRPPVPRSRPTPTTRRCWPVVRWTRSITTRAALPAPGDGIAALRAGIHALVEKPAGVYTGQVAELNAFAAANPELSFAIMFNQRNNPLYQRIKEIVDNGEIGAIRRTNWIITTWWRPQGYYDQSAWRATWGGEGGGVLVNQAPHQLDLWQWICGVPQSVFAKVAYGFRRDIAVEDEVTAVVDYGDGATGTSSPPCTTWSAPTASRSSVTAARSSSTAPRRPPSPAWSADERELWDSMGMDDVRKLFTGELNPPRCTPRRSSSSSPPGVPSTPGSWRTSPRTSSTARRCLPPVRTASTASGWPTPSTCPAGPAQEVPLDFDEDEYLSELNKRIRAEGSFPEREL